MTLAQKAGIDIFATGGLGGVHRGAETSMDISADLIELGRTPITVVSSGCKSFLDIPRTLEVLETQGVTVATFADAREGEVDFPGFWARESGVLSPLTVQNEEEAAAMIRESRSSLNRFVSYTSLFLYHDECICGSPPMFQKSTRLVQEGSKADVGCLQLLEWV